MENTVYKNYNNRSEAELQNLVTHQIGQALAIALSYGYFETAQKQIDFGFQTAGTTDTLAGRLYRAEGVLYLLNGLYGNEQESCQRELFAHAALSLITGDFLTETSTEETNVLTARALEKGGYEYLAQLYTQATNTPEHTLDQQLANFPKVRDTLLRDIKP